MSVSGLQFSLPECSGSSGGASNLQGAGLLTSQPQLLSPELHMKNIRYNLPPHLWQNNGILWKINACHAFNKNDYFPGCCAEYIRGRYSGTYTWPTWLFQQTEPTMQIIRIPMHITAK